ncbi:MAG: lysophospholipid acyltransferase family protein [Spirochaetales bacterium]|nr:lysophospholipid acyltransferase family protein [Spirochaetales bacterium]
MIDLSQFETFETEKGRKLSVWRFIFGRRLAFHLALLRIVLRCRSLSQAGKFDNDEFFHQSDLIHDALERYGAKFRITGLNNLHFDGPCVVVANHMSLLETQVMPWIIGSFKPLSIVMKNSLYDSWIFNPIAKATKSISLTRENLRADIDVIMKEGVEYLNQGRSIILFPEGTRKSYFSRSEFNSLGIKLALRAGVRVVPVALKTDFLTPGNKVSDYGFIYPKKPVHIHIGEPVTIEGRGKKEHQQILDFLESNLKSWGVEIREDEK